LPSFNQDNVHLIETRGKGITQIGMSGPEFEGQRFDVDLLIYATGSEVQKTGTYNKIIGKRGVNLDENMPTASAHYWGFILMASSTYL